MVNTNLSAHRPTSNSKWLQFVKSHKILVGILARCIRYTFILNPWAYFCRYTTIIPSLSLHKCGNLTRIDQQNFNQSNNHRFEENKCPE